MLSDNEDLRVHYKHFRDGYPICWEYEQLGTFEATRNERDVTCHDCKQFLEESL